jgi:hypothetical protein
MARSEAVSGAFVSVAGAGSETSEGVVSGFMCRASGSGKIGDAGDGSAVAASVGAGGVAGASFPAT